jgi:hypothetical protein
MAVALAGLEKKEKTMVVIWGHDYDLTPVGKVPMSCPTCNKSPMQLNAAKKNFTLYWMPVWTMEECHVLKCLHCNDDQLYQVKEEAVSQLKALAR